MTMEKLRSMDKVDLFHMLIGKLETEDISYNEAYVGLELCHEMVAELLTEYWDNVPNLPRHELDELHHMLVLTCTLRACLESKMHDYMDFTNEEAMYS